MKSFTIREKKIKKITVYANYELLLKELTRLPPHGFCLKSLKMLGIQIKCNEPHFSCPICHKVKSKCWASLSGHELRKT